MSGDFNVDALITIMRFPLRPLLILPLKIINFRTWSHVINGVKKEYQLVHKTLNVDELSLENVTVLY